MVNRLIIFDKEKDKLILEALKKWIGTTTRHNRSETSGLTEKENLLIEEIYELIGD